MFIHLTGYSRMQSNIKNGERQSTATSYLRPIINRPNLHISLNTMATKVWLLCPPFLIIIILLLSFFLQKFIRHISLRLLNGNQWNFTDMLSTMSRCADYFRNFQNGRRCHGNGQNAKKLKNTKMIIAGYSPNRNWWNLIGTTSTSSGTR